MKTVKTTTLIIFVALFSHLTQAQTFENTCWTATSTAFGITVKLHFYPGNIYAYENDNGYPLDTIGNYYESNDTIRIMDFKGDCNGDTGVYTFQIQNNVLDFTVVSDTCSGRVAQAGGLLWTPCANGNVLENTCWWAADSATTVTVELQFLEGNFYTYKSSIIPYDTIGTYSVSNDTIVFEDFKGDCVGDVGTYTFLIQNNQLDLMVVSDDCLGRLAQADSLLWTDCSVLGTEERQLNISLVAYPNPTNNEVSISGLPQRGSFSYHLFNTNGQIIQAGDLDNPILSLGHLPTGLYLLVIPEINQTIRIQKQ